MAKRGRPRKKKTEIPETMVIYNTDIPRIAANGYFKDDIDLLKVPRVYVMLEKYDKFIPWTGLMKNREFILKQRTQIFTQK